MANIIRCTSLSGPNQSQKFLTFGTIEAVKTSSEMFMPVGGKVIEFNEELADAPEKVNSDPYGEGWIIKVEVTNAAEMDNLLDAEGYKALIG